MKNLDYNAYKALTEREKNCLEGGFQSADAQGLTHEVIEAFDKQLAVVGMEVIQYNTDGDCYFWKIINTNEEHVCSNGNKIIPKSSGFCSRCYKDVLKIQ